MDEIKNAAQTSGEAQDVSAAVGENAGTDNAAQAQAESASEASFTDGSEASGDAKAEGVAAEGEKAKQSKGTRNSEYAERRREAERQKAIKDAEVKATIRALGGVNPFTEEEMKDADDVEEFLAMQEIKQSGGDPVADYMKHMKDRKKAQAAEAARAEQVTARMNTELEDMRASYPDVNIDDLIKDEMFNSYADGKVGRIPLKQIYEGFIRFGADFEKKANDRAAQMVANAKASPGALASAGESSEKYFTPDEVRKMTEKQVHDNYDAITRSMTKW